MVYGCGAITVILKLGSDWIFEKSQDGTLASRGFVRLQTTRLINYTGGNTPGNRNTLVLKGVSIAIVL